MRQGLSTIPYGWNKTIRKKSGTYCDIYLGINLLGTFRKIFCFLIEYRQPIVTLPILLMIGAMTSHAIRWVR